MVAVRSLWIQIKAPTSQPTNPINNVNTDIHPEPSTSQLPEAAEEIAHRAADTAKEAARVTVVAKDVAGAVKEVAGDVSDAAKDAAKRATDTAKEMYQSAALKADGALATSREYVRQNPVPVVLGAIAVFC